MSESHFEKDLERLETIVAALEEGELSLDESLKRFEEGIRLARRCEKALTQAEKRIEILVKNADGDMEGQPFEGESASSPSSPRQASDDLSATDSEDADEEDGSLLF